jgi:murein DD-endopeptidase MepM/ murein hydrolase activator NlpD
MIRIFPVADATTANCGPYGMRGSQMHYGVDLCAPTGTPLLAVDDGRVHFGIDPKGGNVAILHAQDGVAYYYAHLQRFEGVDRQVQAGDVIGYVDMTGNAASTVPHVHFEAWPSGNYERTPPDPTAQLFAAPLRLQSATRPRASPDLGGAIATGAIIVSFSGLLALAIRARPLHVQRRAM